MEVFNTSKQFNEKTVVALGFFDGVHIAHRALIEKAVSLSKGKNCKSVVYTFDKNIKNNKLITDNEQKKRLIEMLEVDSLVFENVNEDFLKTTPQAFVKEIIKNRLNACCVVIGKHYTFGYKGAADSSVLVRLCQEEGIETFVMPLMELDDFLVSSTHIRFFIESGEIEKVNKFLGRNFSVRGIVEHGNHIGHTIGFPTVNIYPEENMVIPRYGVYCVYVYLKDKKYQGIANVGVKPTIGSEKPLIEAHIFDIEDIDVYYEHTEIEFLSFIRTEKTFENIEMLGQQISQDKERAREYFQEKNAKKNILPDNFDAEEK